MNLLTTVTENRTFSAKFTKKQLIDFFTDVCAKKAKDAGIENPRKDLCDITITSNHNGFTIECNQKGELLIDTVSSMGEISFTLQEFNAIFLIKKSILESKGIEPTGSSATENVWFKMEEETDEKEIILTFDFKQL